jgi:hypothetical protein
MSQQRSLDVLSLPVLHFNVAIAGDMTGVATAQVRQQIQARFEACFTQLRGLVARYNQPQFGFLSNPPVFRVLYSECMGTSALDEALSQGFIPYQVSPFPETLSATSCSGPTQMPSIQQVIFDMPAAFPGKAMRELANWMVEQSDLVLAIWDGTETFEDGAVWEVILSAAERHVPVIWVDAHCPGRVLWSEDTRRTDFTPDKLEAYLDRVLGLSSKHDGAPALQHLKALVEPQLDHKPAWASYYETFIHWFKVTVDKSPGDSLLIARSPAQPLDRFHTTLTTLRRYYAKADRVAIAYNDYYRSSLLLRAILPLLATLGLAIGFYIKNLGSVLFTDAFAWGWLAAGGFLLQAFFNYATVWLAHRSDGYGWHRNFLDQRYIAETMRLALHFVPLNIPLGGAFLSAYGNKAAEHTAVRHRLRSLLREAGVTPLRYDPTVKQFFFGHVEELLDDQIVYHRTTARRYQKIYRTLSRAAAILFWTGIIIVLARAGIQLAVQGIDAQSGVLKEAVHHATLVTREDLLSSVSNLLAMLMPAVAIMLNTVLTTCGFQSLYERAEKMDKSLQQVKELVQAEQYREGTSYEDYCRIARQIVSLMLGEVTDWYGLLTTKKITKS